MEIIVFRIIKPTSCTNFSYLFLELHPDTASKLSANLSDVYLLLCVRWKKKSPDDGQKTCPKHVQFYFKNKFQKLADLFGFIIRIYHDARSHECKIIILPLLEQALLTNFSANEDFFRCFLDSANEYFIGCAR